jgi:hypothetical protein
MVSDAVFTTADVLVKRAAKRVIVNVYNGINRKVYEK